MKKFVAALFLFCAALVGAAAAAENDSAAELLRSRTAIVWVGGQRFGDMVAGANAKLYFQFFDKKLIERIYSEPSSFPDDIIWHAADIDKASRAKCSLVMILYRALTPWTFDPAKITLNGEPLEKKRVYSSLLAIPTGQIGTGTEDVITFGVPRSLCRPGSTLVFGYDGETAEFVVPGKVRRKK